MALGRYKQELNVLWAVIANGEIVMKAEQSEEHAYSRVTKEGVTVWQKAFSYLDGYITGIEVRDLARKGSPVVPNGELLVTIQDIDQDGSIEVCKICMTLYSSYAKRFLRVAANIEDFSKRIRLIPWKIEDKTIAEKFYYGISISDCYVGAEKVPPKYRHGDGILPDSVPITIKGQPSWDDSNQIEFLLAELNGVIKPKIEALAQQKAAQATGRKLGLSSFGTAPQEAEEADFEVLDTASTDESKSKGLPF